MTQPNAASKACVRCGSVFQRKYGLSSTQWQKREFCSKQCSGIRRSMSDAEIVQMYLDGKSTSDISEGSGVSNVQIMRIIRPHGIIREASERQKIASQKPSRIAGLANRERVPCPDHVKRALREVVGSAHPLWKGGITKLSAGYLVHTLSPENGENAGRSIHVVVAEKKIGRAILPGEHVHHVDGNKQNNDPSNLQVMTASAHARLHAIQHRLGHKK